MPPADVMGSTGGMLRMTNRVGGLGGTQTPGGSDVRASE
jgi:hypothetical protein